MKFKPEITSFRKYSNYEITELEDSWEITQLSLLRWRAWGSGNEFISGWSGTAEYWVPRPGFFPHRIVMQSWVLLILSVILKIFITDKSVYVQEEHVLLTKNKLWIFSLFHKALVSFKLFTQIQNISLMNVVGKNNPIPKIVNTSYFVIYENSFDKITHVLVC